MSLYNMMNRFNPACVFIMPMLGRKTEEYPRFRDCFVTEEKNIAIYTRVGGNNRNCGFGEETLYEDENFLRSYDDGFDSTYATYEFKVPDKWKSDFDKIMDGKMSEVSQRECEKARSKAIDDFVAEFKNEDSELWKSCDNWYEFADRIAEQLKKEVEE